MAPVVAQIRSRARHARPAPGSGAIVWAWNAQRLEFDAFDARRAGPDTYEVVRAPRGTHGLAPGDIVRCELSEGELLVHERVWLGRLL